MTKRRMVASEFAPKSSDLSRDGDDGDWLVKLKDEKAAGLTLRMNTEQVRELHNTLESAIHYAARDRSKCIGCGSSCSLGSTLCGLCFRSGVLAESESNNGAKTKPRKREPL